VADPGCMDNPRGRKSGAVRAPSPAPAFVVHFRGGGAQPTTAAGPTATLSSAPAVIVDPGISCLPTGHYKITVTVGVDPAGRVDLDHGTVAVGATSAPLRLIGGVGSGVLTATTRAAATLIIPGGTTGDVVVDTTTVGVRLQGTHGHLDGDCKPG